MNSRVGERVQMPPGVNGIYRANPDTFTNSHGKILKSICKNSNCVLLNNLEYNTKIFDGDYTFEKAGKKSQNDFCITNVAGLRTVERFSIHNLEFNFSDHRPISVTCNIPILTGANSSLVAKDLLSNACDKSVTKQKKIDSACMDWKAYEILANLKLKSIVDELSTIEYSDEFFEKAVNEMDDTLYKSALFCQGRKSDSPEAVETFMPENRTVDDIQRDIATKEREKWNKIMNSSDPKSLWKNIAWKETKQDIYASTPFAEEFCEFFISKATIEGEEPFVLDPLDEGPYCPELDDPIAVGEVYAAEKRLKEGKSTADGWTPGMLKSVSALLYPLLVMVFSMILQFSHYPEKWRNTVVNTLFKNKGVTWLPKYFRPISLVQLLAKMFDFILLERFRKWFQPHDCQSAYQCGKCCAGHVFLLRALICHCMSNNSKLFIICIDFEGAFDKVSRHHLFRKLRLFGCGTVFLTCLMAIYAVTPCTIFQGKGSYTYLLFAGIKQGLPLSPWLFLFYINDIFDFFDGIYGMTSLLETIHLLIHADDTTILASSREAAEAKLKTMLHYCALNHISLQMSKCEFIVINGNDEDKKDFSFPTGSVKHVSYVTLLGSQLAESGNIKDDLKFHMKNRYPAVMKYFNFLRSNKLAPTAVKLKVLESCVTSALLHNCEAFGDCMPDELESLYFTLIKSALDVRKSTANDLVLIESGLLNIKAVIQSRQYKFYDKYVSNLKPDSARMHVFTQLRQTGCKYLQHYSDLFHNHGSPRDIKTKHQQQLKEKINSFANNGKHSKYKLYTTFNPELKSADHTKSFSYKFSRLRLSSHSMPVELCWWNRIARDVRLCNDCKVVGDEKHL